MKYQFIIIITLLFAVTACSPKRSKVVPKALPTLVLKPGISEKIEFSKQRPILEPKVLLSLERYPCFGKCPVYKIEFFDNGLVQYSGKEHTDLIGDYTAQISKEALYNLLQFAANIDYSEFSRVYPTSGKIILDVPLTITYVQYGAEINKIENHHNAPVDLVRFEQHIELLISNLELVN